MNLDIKKIEQRLRCFQIANEVSWLKKGRYRDKAVRIETAFRYPDGSNIDLYLYETNKQLKISDFGDTFTWLSHLLIDPTQTKKRKRNLENTLCFHHAELNGSMIERTCDDLNQLQATTLELGLACVKISEN